MRKWQLRHPRKRKLLFAYAGLSGQHALTSSRICTTVSALACIRCGTGRTKQIHLTMPTAQRLAINKTCPHPNDTECSPGGQLEKSPSIEILSGRWIHWLGNIGLKKQVR